MTNTNMKTEAKNANKDIISFQQQFPCQNRSLINKLTEQFSLDYQGLSVVSLQEFQNQHLQAFQEGLDKYIFSYIGARQQVDINLKKKKLKNQVKQSNIHVSVEQVLLKTKLLKKNMKIKFIKKLPNYNSLRNFIQQIFQILSEEAFQQLIVMVYYIFTKYLKYKESFKITPHIKLPTFPRNYDLDNIDLDFCQKYADEKEKQSLYTDISIEDLYTKAQKIAHQLKYFLFFKKQIKSFSFRNINTKQIPQKKIELNFQEFLKVLSRNVLGLCQNVYEYPSLNDSFKRRSSIYFTSFNQDVNENDDFAQSIRCEPSKQRKTK